MTKRMNLASSSGSKKKQNTGSSAVRSEIQELPTFRGTAAFESGVLSIMFGISSALGAISKAQEVLLDKIESIALKVESLEKEVQSMKVVPPQVPEMISPDPSWLPSNEVIQEWLSLPISSPERTFSLDLICSETPYPSSPRLSDLGFQSDGSMDLPEWARVDWPTPNYLTPTSRNQEPNGGMDTYVNKM